MWRRCGLNSILHTWFQTMPLKCPYFLLFASFPLATVAFLGLGLVFVFWCFINTTWLYWFKKNSALWVFCFSWWLSGSVSYFGAERNKLSEQWVLISRLACEQLSKMPTIRFRTTQKSCQECRFLESHLFPLGIRWNFSFLLRKQRLILDNSFWVISFL